MEIFDHWMQLTENQQNNLAEVWVAFQAYFEPKSHFRLSQFQLRDLRLEAGEQLDSFFTRLRLQASKCSFANLAAIDDNILGELIKGTAQEIPRPQSNQANPKCGNGHGSNF